MSTKQPTSEPLREEARKITKAYHGADGITAKGEKDCAALDDTQAREEADVATLESKVDPENLAQITDIEARKKQVALKKARREAEKKTIRADAKKRADQVRYSVDVQKFFKAAYAAHRARLMAYLGVEFHLPVQQSSLEYIVNNFPSSERFRWWIQEGSSVSPESIAARLAPFVEGKIPLWRV